MVYHKIISKFTYVTDTTINSKVELKLVIEDGNIVKYLNDIKHENIIMKTAKDVGGKLLAKVREGKFEYVIAEEPITVIEDDNGFYHKQE
jgi:hypothetical protein